MEQNVNYIRRAGSV